NLREWLRAEKSFVGTEDEWLSKHQLERLEQLLQVYENWFLERQQQTLELPEEFAMNTAQLVARQHMVEVACQSTTDRGDTEVIIETNAGMSETSTPYMYCQDTVNHTSTLSLARQSMDIYINEMTEKLHGPLTAFVSTAERYSFLELLRETKEWLRVEGVQSTFQEFQDRLNRLETIGLLIEQRLLERVELVKEFKTSIEAMEVEWHSIIDGDAVDEIIEVNAEKPRWTTQNSPYPMVEVACQSTTDRGDTEVIIETNAGMSETSTPYMYCQDTVSHTSTLSLARQSMDIYINEMTEKLHGPLTAFVSTAERYSFLELLRETKEWLRVEGVQSTFQEFQDRLNRLETIGLLIEQRLLERVELVKEFKTSIEHYRRILAHIRAGDPFYVNLEPGRIEQLAASLDQYENWLREHQLKQQSFQSSMENVNNNGPHLGTNMIAEKLQSLRNIWNSLITVDDLVPVCDVMIEEEKAVAVEDHVDWPSRSPANWQNYREPNLYTITIKLRNVPRFSDNHASE
ncbi:hypothetical protein AHF37_01355, partial [Paragonimus kellicotti]